jgi:glucokinase
MNNIAIDMGGTRVKVGLFDGNELISNEIIPAYSQENFERTIENIDAAISKLMRQNKLSSIDGIGLSIPGLVDTKANKVISINEKYNDSIFFDLNKWAKNTWNVGLVTENDARAALAGEWKNGSGKNVDNLVMMTLGTGIGGAALIEGKLLHGKHYQAGCLGGHFTIDFLGSVCTCGNRGCVETKGSSWVLPRLAEEYNYDDSKAINFEKLFGDMRSGNKTATEILDVCMDAWSACAVNLIHAYDPEMVIVGGGVMKSADIILPRMKTWIDKYAWTPWGKVELKVAQLEDTAALYGMNYLIAQ